MLPPTVTVDVTGDLREYFRQRVAQHISDSYCDIPLAKFPEDLRVYEHLIWEAKPAAIVELGTQFGASALWLRDRLHALARYERVPSPIVLSVDIDQAPAREALAQVDRGYAQTIHLVEGDVRDPALAEQVRAIVGDASCMVIEDSAHTYDTTLAALRLYSTLVPPAGFFIVEDGCVDIDELRVVDDWPRGVLPAIDDWLRDNPGWKVRRDLELYGVSCHPGGFLQRA